MSRDNKVLCYKSPTLDDLYLEAVGEQAEAEDPQDYLVGSWPFPSSTQSVIRSRPAGFFIVEWEEKHEDDNEDNDLIPLSDRDDGEVIVRSLVEVEWNDLRKGNEVLT